MEGRLEHDDSKAVAHANAARKAGAARRCDPFAAYTGAAAEAYNDRMFPVPDIGRRVDAVDDANGVINTGAWGSALFAQAPPGSWFRGAAAITAPVLISAGTANHQMSVWPHCGLATVLTKARIRAGRMPVGVQRRHGQGG